MCNSGGSVCRRCISKESESVNMKLREQLLACGFDGDERRLQALLEWLHGEDVSCLGHLVGAPPVHEIRGANAFQEEDLNISICHNKGFFIVSNLKFIHKTDEG